MDVVWRWSVAVGKVEYGGPDVGTSAGWGCCLKVITAWGVWFHGGG